MNNRFSIHLIVMLLLSHIAVAQYAPQYPQPGHEAISHTDSRIVAWADRTTVERGMIDILDPSLGTTFSGSPDNCSGPADGMIVSLGDGGHAVLEFDIPIINGPGPDFAVFENGFHNLTNKYLAFLELAFVEVSTDGIHYVRFPAYSHIPVDTQNINETHLDARFVHNLAGKYIKNQGTPFDLEDLKDSANIDINNIRYVKIIDVIGIINHDVFTNYDADGRMINDPYPTPFPTGGFDLDAVGVLNNTSATSIDQDNTFNFISIYPNPTIDILHLEVPKIDTEDYPIIIQSNGIEMNTKISHLENKYIIETTDLPPGLYFVKWKKIVRTFVKQ